MIEGKIEGKRPRGRKRMMMLDGMMKPDDYQRLKEEAKDREKWRRRFFL